MSGLYGSLSIALSALASSQQALETTANNVANANTPGYSRQRSVLEPALPVNYGPLTFGTGVVISKIESLRDPILEIQLNQQTQHQSRLDTELQQLQQIQTGFGSASSGIGADITKFFNALQQLSPDPTNLALRQAVLTAAGNLATDFNLSATNLQTQGSNLNQSVTESIGEVNTLTAEIASVNQQISYLENVHQNASSLVDQQTSLIRKLSSLIDVQVIPTDQGISLTTSSGAPLVSGGQSFALSTDLASNGSERVMSGSQDITNTLTGGSLAGTIHIRDVQIPGMLGQLDQLAAVLSTALNTANHAGYDLSGNLGGNLFVAPPVGGVGAASGIRLAITDPTLLAASTDGTPGSNGNLATLSAVHDQGVVNGQTPLEYYSNTVFQVGSTASNTSADASAADQILRQLQDQRGSVSGVSLDEEAANMVQFQTAYQAAARVVSTVNALLSDAVNLGLGGTMQ